MAEVRTVCAAVLTVSDSCSRGHAVDKSGPNLKKLLRELKTLEIGQISEKCVPDEIDEIKNVLLQWVDVDNVDLILTTGGTGFSPRDVTPEATKSVVTREAPGMSLQMISKSLEVTPMAMLSRPVCGIRGQTLIINLPGSVKASQECFMFIEPALPHALDLLSSRKKNVQQVHQTLVATGARDSENIKMQQSSHHNCPHRAAKLKYDLSKVAERDRHSRYPLTPIEEAVSTILKHASSLGTKVVKETPDALGYVLAHDVYANESFPPFAASIKDGYAVLTSDGVGIREVLGPVLAGDMPSLPVTRGRVVRISTGAPIPPGADAVVQVEDTRLIESCDGETEIQIEILVEPKLGQDIRPVGFDINKGEKVLCQGDLLGPAELGLLATTGVNMVEVFKKPTTAILSTGNEIAEPFVAHVKKGQIRDSNRTSLIAAFKQHGFPVVDMGISSDNVTALKKKLVEGLASADIIVTSGGVSMGEKDLLKPLLQDELEAKIHFGRVFMKPGKPTTFATIQYQGKEKMLFCLPGNPVSALVGFYLFVFPALKKFSRSKTTNLTKIKAKVSANVVLDPRPEYHRVFLSWQGDDPIPVATSTGSQCSSRLLSMRSANGLLVLPPQTDSQKVLVEGSVVDALLIDLPH